jgi:hypothetical protein
MRFLIATAIFFGIFSLPVAGHAQTTQAPTIAPLDEYFGQSSESVLEIRNRIIAVETKSDGDARTTDTVAAIDYFEEALVDWQHKYPADPWVADALSRTVRCYARAGVAGSAHALEVYAVLTKMYPKSPATDRALLALWESPAAGSEKAGLAMASAAVIPLAIP